MFKRVTIVALLVAAFALLMAVPALAFNGMREDYTTVEGCACHNNTGGAVSVVPAWQGTKHAVSGVDNQALRLPYGSVCAGCHTANFDPSKVIPEPTATSTSGAVSWGVANAFATPGTQPTASPGAASSENFVGCSSCHYGSSYLPTFGDDPNNTAHNSPYGLLASAEICGQCHSRYSYTVDTYSVSPVPYVQVTGTPATPVTPNPNPTTEIQPQMALGYPMLGSPAPSPSTGWGEVAPLTDYLNIQTPGWTPTPTATSAAGLQTYWMDANGDPLPWQTTGHDGSAAQYPDWAISAHAASLTALTSQPFWSSFPEATKEECLGCHSADFRILKANGDNPTSADAQYGITCVGCHDPHNAGTVKGVWDKNFDAQLINDASLNGNGSNLCIECHTDQLAAGTSAKPGDEVHNAQKEIMAGYGAIGVPQIPSVHEGKCIQCHMPPTENPDSHSTMLGANHTMMIIDPSVAANATDGSVDMMPFSACSTCHGRASDPEATYLQGTITQRQTWTKGQISQLDTELDAAAVKLGYADAASAQAALVAKPESSWTVSETAFLSAWTNTQFLGAEGSYGIHNWAYTNAIANQAQVQVKAVTAKTMTAKKYVVTLARNKSSVKRYGKVTYRGNVMTGLGLNATGHLTLQIKKKGGSWKNWHGFNLKSNGTYYKTYKMTQRRGTYYVKAKMPGDGGLNLTAYSHYVKVVIK